MLGGALMMRNRAGRASVLVGAGIAVVMTTGIAYAASVGVTSNSLGGGTDTVGHCDSNPSSWTVTYHQNSSGDVTGVLVSNIASTCNGQQLYIALRKGATAPVATGSATISSGSADVTTLSTTPAYSAVDRVDMVTVGT